MFHTLCALQERLSHIEADYIAIRLLPLECLLFGCTAFINHRRMMPLQGHHSAMALSTLFLTVVLWCHWMLAMSFKGTFASASDVQFTVELILRNSVIATICGNPIC